uniref:U2-plectoxin-Pt1a n=1 Tax=Plectreurys tristis TaxID=33319 RepID=TXP9_PLETR|nr:RecName: Full=U2-plectoxin-Pt1a; Short=U2-PLTX-Pt1a; AltName: Full=Plectoxin IX; Short=PLT-IX; Short=PLTIX; AltName: Full=Plectoxin-9 [Plectreurys tristis]
CAKHSETCKNGNCCTCTQYRGKDEPMACRRGTHGQRCQCVMKIMKH